MAAFNSNPPACHRFLITPLEAAANYPQAGGCVPGVTSPRCSPSPPRLGALGKVGPLGWAAGGLQGPRSLGTQCWG